MVKLNNLRTSGFSSIIESAAMFMAAEHISTSWMKGADCIEETMSSNWSSFCKIIESFPNTFFKVKSTLENPLVQNCRREIMGAYLISSIG